MEEENDMFVVIIGDEEDGTEEEKIKPGISGYIFDHQVKQEVMEPSELEKLLREADEHGVINIIKSEPEDMQDYECLDDDIQQTEDYSLPVKQELTDDYSDLDTSDSDSLPEKKKKRATMLKPGERHSFVQELILKYPDLKQDETSLIKLVAEAMSVPVPDPPRDYFLIQGIHFVCHIGSCAGVSESIAAAKRHYQEKHGPRYLICFACGVDFRSPTNLYKHEKRCQAPDRNLVLKARALFLGNKGRHRPYINRDIKPTTKQSLVCHLCGAQFKFKASFEAHMYHHQGLRPYQCQLCPRGYTSHSALLRHKLTHECSTFICDLCGRVCKTRVTLIAHIDTHRPIKKFGCEECDKRFASRTSYKLHVRTEHRNLPQPFACQICPKRYPRLTLLKTHMIKEHGMSLMTKKMFYKLLPTLTEDQVEQAKIVMKKDVDGWMKY